MRPESAQLESPPQSLHESSPRPGLEPTASRDRKSTPIARHSVTVPAAPVPHRRSNARSIPATAFRFVTAPAALSPLAVLRKSPRRLHATLAPRAVLYLVHSQWAWQPQTMCPAAPTPRDCTRTHGVCQPKIRFDT